MSAGKRWTRDELLVALNVYRKLRFGQLHHGNPVIKDVATKLARTPDSVAMKLSNLAALDPALQARGIRGLQGASGLDRAVWEEFHADPDALVPQSEEAFRKLFEVTEDDEVDVVPARGVRVRRLAAVRPPVGPTEKQSQVSVRRGQQYFRQVVLNAFDSQCCVTGIPIRKLLVASHILPWGQFPAERLNPQNGLCLSRLHDAAFDQGLISVDEDYRLMISRKLTARLPQAALEDNFLKYADQPITVPIDGQPPSLEFLRYHRSKIFERNA